MTESVSRIQLLDPERIAAIIEHHQGRDRDALATGLLRLLYTQTGFIMDREPPRRFRVATILPSHRSFDELDWTIMDNPDPTGFHGQHVINGGLIRHQDGTWGSHT